MKKVLVIVLSLAMVCVGCSAAWVSTLDAILAAAAPALVNVLQIIALANGKPLDSNLASKIATDAADIKTLAGDFAKASSAAGPGVCQQLQAAISAYSADQSLVLQLAQVSDTKTQTKILLLLNLVEGTVAAITAVIPSCQAPAQAHSFQGGAPPLKLKAFVSTYNNVLTAPTGNADVDRLTKKLTIHEHSKVTRVLTFGYLN